MYEFDISDFRNIESAGFCYFDKPCLHPSRKMEVHDFIYMINGEWNICVDDKTYQMRNDDILILPAYRQHYGITPCSPKTKTMYFHIYTHPNDKIFNNQQTISGIIVKRFLNTSTQPNIKRIFEKILQTRYNKGISSAYVNTLIFELGELSTRENNVSIAKAIHDYIILSDRIPTNDEIANHFNVSKRTAETLFKNNYNTTIHNFILTHKLNEAKRYLVDYPDMKINSIALTLGFYDQYHFSKMFTRTYGVSPSIYRKQNIVNAKDTM